MAAVISPAYQIEQQALHAKGNYGTASIKHAETVTKIINSAKITHLLDYGCGSLLNLYKHIKPEHKLTYQAYDPGVPKYLDPPVPAQMVACIDVLEHIEPEYLDNVLDDLVRVTESLLYCTIHTGPAGKTLSDGRNAHLIQQPLQWWFPKLCDRFEVSSIGIQGLTICCVLYAKPRLEAVNGDRL